jgi:hypothetical protein
MDNLQKHYMYRITNIILKKNTIMAFVVVTLNRKKIWDTSILVVLQINFLFKTKRGILRTMNTR